MAHPGVHDLEQVVPNTSVQQDLTHEDEYRDGKRREAVQGGEHRRPDDLEGKPEQEDQDEDRKSTRLTPVTMLSRMPSSA